MWTYEQSTGWWLDPNGKRAARGYSGKGAGLNNPAMEDVRGVKDKPNAGPIPRGTYRILPPEDDHGGFALHLAPFPENDMHGRGDFVIHGDLLLAKKYPFSASLGCPIAPRWLRQLIWSSPDHLLQVV